MTGTQVLVVDDDPTVSDVVRRYLERAGFAVTLAADGPAALAAAERHAPDLVVLDLMLPGMSGLDVCRRLRERSDVPVVMLTALGEEVDRVVGFEVGADDYVTRAFSRADLLEQVWGWSFGDQATVTVHVRRLREKIERDPAEPTRIVTVWGVGYRFEPAAAGA